MLHPVGPLPAAVYWRRRLLVLGCALGVLGGGGWVGVAATTGGGSGTATEAAGSTGAAPVPTPALEQVLPSLAAVQVPTSAPVSSSASGEPAPATSSAPAEGGPCSDDMIDVSVRPVPVSTPAGSKPTFELVVTNTSSAACVRTLDKGLQEVVLLDASGNRVWGSNDCFPEESADARTLQAGEAVVFPVLWSGLSSEPGCAGSRTTPSAGGYVVRGRLDAKMSADAAFTLT